MDWLEKIVFKIFGEPKWKEYEQFYGSFSKLFSGQINHIIDVINEEIKISEKKFGLVLREDDKLKEKVAILTVFNECGQLLARIGEKLSIHDYNAHVTICTDAVFRLMRDEIGYHFDNTPEGEVKNRYNCHLGMVSARLTKDFLNKDVPF